MKNVSAIFLASSILLPITNVSAAPIFPEHGSNYQYLLQEFGGEAGLGTKVDSYTCEEGCYDNDYGYNPLANYFDASLPFSVNYAGNNYQKVFANRDGNLTFTEENSLEESFQSDGSFPRITALNSPSKAFDPYGNFDGSAVYVGKTDDKIAITWENLTPETSHGITADGQYIEYSDYGPIDASNTFQLVLIDRADTGEGNFDVEFRYENVEWWSYDDSGNGNYRGFDGGPGTENLQDYDRYPEHIMATTVDHPDPDRGNVVREAGFDAYQVREGVAYYTDYRGNTNPLFQFQTPPDNTGNMEAFEGCVGYFDSIKGTPEYELEITFIPEGKTIREACAEWTGVNLENIEEIVASTGEGTFEDPFMPINDDRTEDGGWDFAFEAVADQLQAIDPDVAVGYEYVVNSGPNVKSVVLPTGFDNNLFDIFTKDNNGLWQLVADEHSAGVEFNFGLGGVDEFKIDGIEISNALDPLNPQAFTTLVSFVNGGAVNITQTPITQFVAEVPEPQTLFIFAGALSGLALMRRRKLIK